MFLTITIPTWAASVVALLSLLTTALIGWQIFAAIDLYKIRRDINKKIDKEFQIYSSHISAIANTIIAKLHYHNYLLLDTIMFTTGKIYKKHDLFECSLNYLAAALEDLNKSSKKDSASLIYQELIQIIKYLTDKIEQLKNISPDTIRKVINGVMQDTTTLEAINKIEIINKLIKLENLIMQIHDKNT